MPDISTHIGSKIFVHDKKDQYIVVQIQEINNCKADEVPMVRDEYEKCVDNRIEQEFEMHNMSCIPPWLSSNKQCNETYSEDLFDTNMFEFYNDYVKKVMALDNIKHEINCRLSCKKTIYDVNERESLYQDFDGTAHINFNQKVTVTKKVPNYNMFNYIIDVGSSLGLWLGLSILSLYDLVEIVVQFIKNNFIIKKIRSAFSK